MILTSLRKLYENKQKKSYPTFWGTVEAVSRQNKRKKRDVANLLRSLMAKDCVKQDSVTLDGKKIKTVTVDWKKCKILGYWE